MAHENIERCINSVFQREWWLNALAPSSWRYLTVGDDKNPDGIFPIVQSRYFGLHQIKMPLLTFVLGPGLIPTEGSPAKRLSQEIEWLDALLDKLPPFDYFNQNFHFRQHLALPFLWRNFEVSALHTYSIEDLTDLDRVWSNYRKNTRALVRKAQKLVEVVADPDIRDIWRLSEMSFARRGRRPAYSFETLQCLDNACRINNGGKGFVAKAADGTVHAAIYIVWDEHAAYYLIGGVNPLYKSSGAMSLVMHEAICHASTVSRRFDMQGCNAQGFEAFKRGFGGELKTLFQVRGYSRKMRIAQAVQTFRLPAYRSSESSKD